jgi:uncharacterized protein YicC (UPF0701 family)
MLQSETATRHMIASEAEAKAVLTEIARLMTELCDIVEEETALVRSGRLTSAARIAKRKGDLARDFVAYATRVRASTRFLSRHTPKMLEALRQQHEQFRTRLQINLTVLATARAVSEGILRGVSNELARRSTVQTYGASGRRLDAARTGAPIALSRSL